MQKSKKNILIEKKQPNLHNIKKMILKWGWQILWLSTLWSRDKYKGLRIKFSPLQVSKQDINMKTNIASYIYIYIYINATYPRKVKERASFFSFFKLKCTLHGFNLGLDLNFMNYSV